MPDTAVSSVLFVCVHNAGRSQMAAAFLTHLAGDRVQVRSAGSAPAASVNPAVVAAMAEVGIDIAAEVPKVLTAEAVQASDVVITMGCGDTCPVFPRPPSRRVRARAEPKPRHETGSSTRATPVSCASPSCGRMPYEALSATGASPTRYRKSPVAIMTSTPLTNRYVGAAKARPDSRTPRRFTTASSATKPSAIGTRCACNWGTAEMMLSTPEATDTATVIT